MNKDTIMVDMDDVITKGGFLYLLNKYLHTNYKETDFSFFRMQDIMKYEQRLDFFKWFKNYNMYDYCTLVSGAYQSLKTLNDYYNIVIATAYIFPEAPEISGKFLGEKFNFLYSNFPFINSENIIFINRKDLLRTFCKIDDRVTNLKNAEKLFLFPAYHNLNMTQEELTKLGIEKTKGWEDITQKLIKKV